jgi:hypothetical protein
VQIAVAATPEVALPTLEALLESEHDLVSVITQPDRPAGRGLSLKESPVAMWAKDHKEFMRRLDAIPAAPVGVNELPTDTRLWPFYPIEMPLNKFQMGPATVGIDAATITYEVWDRDHTSHGSFDNLPDAINAAMRLSRAALQEKGGAE